MVLWHKAGTKQSTFRMVAERDEKMNNQELIKILRNMQGEMVSESDYAIEEAIKALEEQDKHRWNFTRIIKRIFE